MRAEYLSFEETGVFPRLIIDYLNGSEKVDHLYKYPLSWDSVPRIMEEKAMQNVDRPLLIHALQDIYSSLDASESVKKNIYLLAKEGTYTVTTAHQPCLMTGPLYFIVKIADTIRLAEELKKRYPENDFVPVYWMGSEDHDFEEINHLYVHRKIITWEKDANGPVGRLKLKGIDNVLHELEATLGDGPWAKEWMQILRKYFKEDKTLAQATLGLVNELFGRYGLLVMIGDRGDLKEKFRPVMEREILERKSRDAVQNKIEILEKNGYKVQAYPREINLFYFNDGIRERILYQPDDDSFRVQNTHIYFDRESVLEELKNCPDHFSPNVILRPVYQEMILPNLIFLGGAGEISYWLELEEVFELYKVNFPMLAVRNSVMVIEENIAKKLEQLKLGLHDIFEEESELIKKIVTREAEEEVALDKEREEITRAMLEIKARAKRIDPTLERSVEGELQKILKSLEKIETKLLRAEKRKHETLIRQIQLIKEQLLPGGKLHERLDNVANYYAKYGPAFLEQMTAHLQPIDRQLIALYP